MLRETRFDATSIGNTSASVFSLRASQARARCSEMDTKTPSHHTVRPASLEGRLSIRRERR